MSALEGFEVLVLTVFVKANQNLTHPGTPAYVLDGRKTAIGIEWRE